MLLCLSDRSKINIEGPQAFKTKILRWKTHVQLPNPRDPKQKICRHPASADPWEGSSTILPSLSQVSKLPGYEGGRELEFGSILCECFLLTGGLQLSMEIFLNCHLEVPLLLPLW